MPHPALARVAIVDDNAAVRENWAQLLNLIPGFRCVCTCATGEEALERLPQTPLDIVLMDMNLPGMSGAECTGKLKRLLPEVQVLILTAYSDHERVLQALQAGAVGYLLKRANPDQLLNAITGARAGEVQMTGEIARKALEIFRGSMVPKRLTPEEEEILTLLAGGYSNEEIASRLGLSLDTIRSHLKRIYDNLRRVPEPAATSPLLQSDSNPV